MILENSCEHSIFIENIYGTELFEVPSLSTEKQTCKEITLKSVKIPLVLKYLYLLLFIIYLFQKLFLMILSIIVLFFPKLYIPMQSSTAT